MIEKPPHIVVNGTATNINNKQRNGIGSLNDNFFNDAPFNFDILY